MNKSITEITLALSIDNIYKMLKDPIIILSSQGNIEKISDMEWKEFEKSGAYNLFRTKFDDENHIIKIRAVNSRYSFKQEDIVIRLESIDESMTKMTVSYITKTTSLLTRISNKIFNNKIHNYDDKIIINNIKKLLKQTSVTQ